jgi:hypothetical protein
MPQRLGNVIYWTASGVALLVVLFGVLRVVSQPIDFVALSVIDFVALSVIAGLIWLAGKTARYVLVG